jgi:hypothetical protein
MLSSNMSLGEQIRAKRPAWGWVSLRWVSLRWASPGWASSAWASSGWASPGWASFVVLLWGCEPQSPAVGPSATTQAPVEQSTFLAEANPEPARSTSTHEPVPPFIEATPAATWARFVEAWNARDKQALETFRSSQGLVLMDNPGAFVRLSRVGSVVEIDALEGHFDRARLKSVRLDAAVSPGDAAENNCAVDAKAEGTFQTLPARLRLKDRWAALTRYQLASDLEVEALRAPVENAEAEGRFAFYDLSDNVGFLFGDEQGHLVLLAIDAVVPCSA